MFRLFQKKRPRRENVRFRRRNPGKALLPVEVVPSSRELRRLRIALSLGVLKIGACATVAVCLIVWLNGLWVRGVHEHRGFAVGRCEFFTDGSLTLPRVQQALGLREDTCILDINLDALRTRLLSMPRVQQAEIERRLPNTLSIRLQECRPVAWLCSTQQRVAPNRARGRLVDADGWVFESESNTAHAGLPVIDMPDITVAQPGSRTADRGLCSALALLKAATSRRWTNIVYIERIQLDVPWMLMADISGGVHVWFARDNLSRRLEGLDYILTSCRERNCAPEMINLACNTNVPVMMRQPENPASDEDSPAPEEAQRPPPSSPQLSRRKS